VAEHPPAQFVVPLSRNRMLPLLGACLAMVGLGAWLWFTAGDYPMFPPLLVQAAAVLCVACFAACAALIARKLLDSRPGLVVDGTGITDNASGAAAGHIPWGDIAGIRITQVQDHRFLTIAVRDPDKYVQRASPLKRAVVAANSRLFGSPVQISTGALDIEFDQLHRQVVAFYARHRPRPRRPTAGGAS
jgi:hypothetical protein